MTNEAAFIATQRFGLGPKPGELKAVKSDPRGWLRAQVSKSALPDDAPTGIGMTEAIELGLAEDRAMRRTPEGRAKTMEQREETASQIDARLRFRMATDAPFAERLIAFWTNHFSFSIPGNASLFQRAGAASFERDTIRPHAFGRFEDMAFWALTYPAMVGYLDNDRSVGPNSLVGGRRGDGINENLARATLELYVMGVDGGYTQADVEQMALVLTGWTFRQQRIMGYIRRIEQRRPGLARWEQHGSAEFFPMMHEPGPKTILGMTFEEAGADEFRNVIRALTRHPSTARFIATKLVRHFIADDPPEAAVRRLADTFRTTEGNLEAVSLQLIELKEAWENPLSKIKSPYDYVLSVGRAMGAASSEEFRPGPSMTSLGQPMFMAPDPRGWPDDAESWITPARLMRRIEWTSTEAIRQFRNTDPRDLLEATIGEVASERLRDAVRGAPSTAEGVAVVLLSPEFQRR